MGRAKCPHYIGRALAGFLAPSREAYAAGLAAIDRHAGKLHGMPFSKLSAADQDAVLKDVEAGKAEGLPSAFFARYGLGPRRECFREASRPKRNRNATTTRPRTDRARRTW